MKELENKDQNKTEIRMKNYDVKNKDEQPIWKKK